MSAPHPEIDTNSREYLLAMSLILRGYRSGCLDMLLMAKSPHQEALALADETMTAAANDPGFPAFVHEAIIAAEADAAEALASGPLIPGGKWRMEGVGR